MKGLSHKISWDISFLNTPYWKRFSPSSNLSRNKRREPLLPHLLPESLGFAHSTNSPPPSSLQIPDVPILPPRKVTKYSPEECEAPEEPRPAARPSPVSGALIQGEQKGSKRTGMGKSPELRRGLPAAPRAQPRGSVPNPVPHPPLRICFAPYCCICSLPDPGPSPLSTQFNPAHISSTTSSIL